MNEYVKENPDCYENILSKAKFPQDYLEKNCVREEHNIKIAMVT